jgi:hypothetical protein
MPRPVRRGSEVFRTIANVNPSIGRATVRDRPNMRRPLPLSRRRPRVVSSARVSTLPPDPVRFCQRNIYDVVGGGADESDVRATGTI